MADAIINDLIDVQTTVRTHFGWSYQDDFESAHKLGTLMSSEAPLGVLLWSHLMRNKALDSLKKKLHSADKVIIVGASVSISDLEQLDSANTVLIAADGSVGAVGGMSGLACIVTDFDGNPHIDKYAKDGMLLIAHAHGDNLAQWQSSLAKWSNLSSPPNLILSHQITEVIDGMYNFGGFTDGDRAVCMALSLGVPKDRITLIGFSTDKVGQWSGQTSVERKLEKLDWMLRILQMLGLADQVSTNASEVC